jgi:hypothetical protein
VLPAALDFEAVIRLAKASHCVSDMFDISDTVDRILEVSRHET